MPLNLEQAATQVNVANSATTTLSISFASTPTTGRAAIYVASAWVNNSTWTLDSTTDNQTGNSYTTRQSVDTVAGTRNRAWIAHAENINASGTFTVTSNVTTGGTVISYVLGLMEWSSVATTSAEDQQLSNNDVDVSVTDINVGPTGTTTQADELAIGCASVNSSLANMAFASPASYTNRYRQNDSGTYIAHDSATRILASTGTQTLQWSHANNGEIGCAVVVTLKEASAAAASRALLSMRVPLTV